MAAAAKQRTQTKALKEARHLKQAGLSGAGGEARRDAALRREAEEEAASDDGGGDDGGGGDGAQEADGAALPSGQCWKCPECAYPINAAACCDSCGEPRRNAPLRPLPPDEFEAAPASETAAPGELEAAPVLRAATNAGAELLAHAEGDGAGGSPPSPAPHIGAPAEAAWPLPEPAGSAAPAGEEGAAQGAGLPGGGRACAIC